MAMTAWSAKVLSSSICLSVNGRTSIRRITMTPTGASSRIRGVARMVRRPCPAGAPGPPGTRRAQSARRCRRMWIVRRSMTARPDGVSTGHRAKVEPWRHRHRAEVGHPAQHVALDPEDEHVGRAAQLSRALGHRVQHRLDVRRRAGDDAQDLGGRRLLLERLGQLAGALLDLAAPAWRRTPAAGPAIWLNWSASASSSSPVLTSIRWSSSPAPIRAAPAWRAWIGRDHAPRQHQARERPTARTPSTTQHDRPLDRRRRGARTPPPAAARRRPTQPQRRDGRVRGQHLAALRIAGDRHLLRPLARAAGSAASAPSPASSSASVVFCSTRLMSGCAMRAPWRVDDVGVAGLADLDLGDDVPDELQIHLGHRDAGAAALRHGDRHVRLGFLAEVHRAEVDVGRPWPRGTSGRASSRCRLPITSMASRDTRSCSWPCGVEVAELGDRQHLRRSRR